MAIDRYKIPPPPKPSGKGWEMDRQELAKWFDRIYLFLVQQQGETAVSQTTEYLLEVSKGNVPGSSIYRKFGRIAAIQAAVPADCWEFGVTVGAEEYTWSTTEAIDSLSSSNAADTQEIFINGLQLDGTEVNQIINLNGQTRVALQVPLYRLNRMYNNNGTATAGNVYCYENTAIVAGVPTDVTKVRGYFSVAGQQTLQAMYTVPKGKTAHLYELKTSVGGRKAGSATYEAFLRIPDGIFLIKDTHDLITVGTSCQQDTFICPRVFPAGTDFKPKITVDVNDIGFSVSFVIVLVDD